MRAGSGKSKPRQPAPRSGCSPVQPESERLDCCSHIPLQLTLLSDFNVARSIWCTPRNNENRFARFSQLLHFVWLSEGKFFLRPESSCRPARQPSTVVVGVRPLSIFVDSKDMLPDVAMMNLSGTPCFESWCMLLLLNGLYCRGWTLPSTDRSLQSFASLQYSKLAFSTLPSSIYDNDLAEHPFTYFTSGEAIAEVGHLELIFTSCPYCSFLRKNSWSKVRQTQRECPGKLRAKSTKIWTKKK